MMSTCMLYILILYHVADLPDTPPLSSITYYCIAMTRWTWDASITSLCNVLATESIRKDDLPNLSSSANESHGNRTTPQSITTDSQ